MAERAVNCLTSGVLDKLGADHSDPTANLREADSPTATQRPAQAVGGSGSLTGKGGQTPHRWDFAVPARPPLCSPQPQLLRKADALQLAGRALGDFGEEQDLAGRLEGREALADGRRNHSAD
jgi:hypothetical protein